MVWKLFQMKERRSLRSSAARSGLLVHLRAFVPERAPGFEAGSSAAPPLQRSLRRAANLGHIRSEDGLVIGGQLLGLSGLVVVEAQRKLKQAI